MLITYVWPDVNTGFSRLILLPDFFAFFSDAAALFFSYAELFCRHVIRLPMPLPPLVAMMFSPR